MADNDNVVIYVLSARGLGESRALSRLIEAVNELSAGNMPKDPGVDVRRLDPGGGGGPCQPQKIATEFLIGPTGLPEAQPNDDD